MLRLSFIFLFVLGLGACDVQVKTDDVKAEAELSGESFSYVIVRLEFINQLIELCSDLILASDYESPELAAQARAQCVFDRLELIDIPIDQFQSDIEQECLTPPEGLTPEQLAQLEALCSSL